MTTEVGADIPDVDLGHVVSCLDNGGHQVMHIPVGCVADLHLNKVAKVVLISDWSF